ncbi:cell division protein FtsZ [Roseospirillum parvum]|nr:cell division protein FtsZ [Roseospirillum parvum]
MSINLTVPGSPEEFHMKPRITVIGVGGAGGNAVNNMIAAQLEGVDFVVANTDAQALAHNRAERRLQLGIETTHGLGAGARPDVGRHAAEEAIDQILAELDGANMVFVTAGMGGGTGTGAAPVIARTAREAGVLTVGVVTKPFQFEGAHRLRLAEQGIEELAQVVDTLIIIPNQNLFRVANEKTTFADAFKMADDVLYSGVRSITDLMVMPGLVNLDFADVRTVMQEMGRAMMGTGEAEGERRALDAAEAAIANPLLEDTCMKGARGVLINITGGPDITLYEVDEAANRIREEVEVEAHIIFGSCFDPELEGKIRVSVVATGLESEMGQLHRPHSSDLIHAVGGRGGAQPAAQPRPQMRTTAQAVAQPVAPPTPEPLAQTVARQVVETAAEADSQAEMAEDSAPTPQPAQGEAHAEPRSRPQQSAAERRLSPSQADWLDQVYGPAVTKPRIGTKAERGEPRRPAARHEEASRKADVFIPEPPVDPGHDLPADLERESPRRPAAREAGRENRQEGRNVVTFGAEEDTYEEVPRGEGAKPRRGSLFSRVTGLARRGPEDAPHGEAHPHHEPRLGGLTGRTEDRPIDAHPEEELEIPAFLRRQAN